MGKWSKVFNAAKDAVSETAGDVADAASSAANSAVDTAKEMGAKVSIKADELRLTDTETAVIEAAIKLVQEGQGNSELSDAVAALLEEDAD